VKKDDIVIIRNQTINGRSIIEGQAGLVKFLDLSGDPERWEVEFLDEPNQTYERYVFQADKE